MNNDEKFGCLKIEEMMFDIDEMSNEELAKIEEEIIKNKIDKIKKALMINKEEFQFIEYKKIMSLYKKRDERRVLKKSDEYKEYRTQINNLSRELMKEIENESPNEAEIKRLNIEIDKMEKEDRLNICEIEIQELKKEIIDSRKLGIEIDKNIDQLTSNIKDYLEKLNRDLELVLYENINKKENFIMRFLSKLLNKIDGETKFKEQVVKITKQKINKIKFSYLPELYVEIESDGIDLVSGVLEKKLRITKQCIEAEELKINAKNIIDSGLNNYKKIIDEGNYRRAESIEVKKL